MFLSQVLTMDQAYPAITWKSLFLLAGLIPLGQAAKSTATAEWIARQAQALAGELQVRGA